MHLSSVYSKTITVPSAVIDGNVHVNNVVYVQWMQDIAVEHYASIGGIEAQGPDATWVVREHRVEYLLPAFAGEQIEIRQGAEIGRPSTLFAAAHGDGDRIERVEVGGSAVVVARGEFSF